MVHLFDLALLIYLFELDSKVKRLEVVKSFATKIISINGHHLLLSLNFGLIDCNGFTNYSTWLYLILTSWDKNSLGEIILDLLTYLYIFRICLARNVLKRSFDFLDFVLLTKLGKNFGGLILAFLHQLLWLRFNLGWEYALELSEVFEHCYILAIFGLFCLKRRRNCSIHGVGLAVFLCHFQRSLLDVANRD